jgi:hypothetical protein
MREFESADTFMVGDRKAYTIVGNWTGTGEEWHPRILNGQTVKIDGNEFEVRGVEVFAVYCDPDQPYHSSFAILT